MHRVSGRLNVEGKFNYLFRNPRNYSPIKLDVSENYVKPVL